MKKVAFMEKYKIVPFFVSIGIPLGVGALSSLFTQDTMAQYQQLKQPSFAPPGWIFPVVWTILYILMGIASYMVYRTKGKQPDTKKALLLYITQLVVNFFWGILFFGLEWRGIALLWLLLLWLLIVLTAVRFYEIRKTAAFLMVPYILWVSFAGILNYAVWQLNRFV